MVHAHRQMPATPAELTYGDGDYKIRKPGAFVLCAATGLKIPLEDLRYWSVDLQEPYAGPAAKLQRLQTLAAKMSN